MPTIGAAVIHPADGGPDRCAIGGHNEAGRYELSNDAAHEPAVESTDEPAQPPPVIPAVVPAHNPAELATNRNPGGRFGPDGPAVGDPDETPAKAAPNGAVEPAQSAALGATHHNPDSNAVHARQDRATSTHTIPTDPRSGGDAGGRTYVP